MERGEAQEDDNEVREETRPSKISYEIMKENCRYSLRLNEEKVLERK
jgi:hypothetical protein